MNTRNTRMLIFFTIILLASLSCQFLSFGGSDKSEETPAASPTTAQAVSPTSASAPTPTASSVTAPPADTQPTSPASGTLPTLPPPQPGPETLDLAGLPESHPLTDFTERLQVVTDFTDPDGVAQQMITDYIFRQTSVPDNAWYTLFEDNNPIISQKYESALVAGQGYTLSSEIGTCQVVIVEVFNNEGQRQPFVDLLESLVGQTNLAEAEVTVGDQVVDAYPVETANLAPGSKVEIKISLEDSSGTSTSTTTLPLADEGSTLESGELYLARQGGYLQRLELNYSRVAGEEDSFLAQEGTTMNRSFVYEVTPATSIEPIQPPAGCQGATGDGEDDGGDNSGGGAAITINDLPRADDATNVIQAGNTLIYQTGLSMDEVLDLYRSDLEASGWVVTDEINLGTVASMDLERDGQTITIALTQSGGSVLVTITVE